MPLDVATVAGAVRAGDAYAVRRICFEAADAGTPVPDIVDVLAGVQVEVGERWLTGEATIADEHRSTAAVDAALAGLELRLPAPPPSQPVICVCAEGEWHALASRMVALAFTAAGRATVFLGPSLPAGNLARFADGAAAAAVAISCSTVAALPGAARCVAAVSSVGVPVIVGGQAFRSVPAVAEALGVPYADDVRAAVAAIDELPAAGRAAELDEAGAGALELAHGGVVELAAKGLLAGGRLAGAEAATVEEAVAYALGVGRAAVLLRDGEVLRDHQPWLEAFLIGRGVPLSAGEVLSEVADAAAEVLGDRKDLSALLAP